MIYRSYPIKFISQFINEYSFSEYFRKYQIIKFFILFLFLGFLISITLFAISLQLFDIHLSATFFSYVLFFWRSNISLLLLIFLIFILIKSNALRGQFRNAIQYKYAPKELDIDIEKTFRKINNWLSYILFIYAVLIAIPVIQLSNTQFISIVLPLSGFLFTIAIKFLPNIFKKRKINTDSDSLSEYKFKGTSFNSGSIGFSSLEVEKELDYYHALGTPNPTSDKVLSYLQGNEKGVFEGYKKIFIQIEKLFNKNNMRGNLNLHSRTTSAVAYAFDFLYSKHNDISFVFDDSAYPSIINLIKKRYHNNYHEIIIQDDLLKNNFDLDIYISEIINQIDSNNQSTTFVIFLSHITYLTGYVFNIMKIINDIKKKFSNENKKIFFVIDGAQSVGNILVNDDILNYSHFYAFCGHKWLLSKPTIGILYINKSLLQEHFTDDEINNLISSVGAFNFYGYNIDDYSGTVQVEPHISLSVSLHDINKQDMETIQKHNTFLKKYFIKYINRLTSEIQPIDYDQNGSIVTLKYELATQLNSFLDRNYNISTFLFEHDKKLIRFSFHYYMSINDVNKLLYGIVDFQHKLIKNDTQQWL